MKSVTKCLRYLRSLFVRGLFPAYEFATAPRSIKFGFDRGTPIDRKYINDFLLKHKLLVKGRCLEIGASEYCDMLGIPLESVYVLGANVSSGGVIPGDLSDISTLPNTKFDTFICTQTLNFIFDFESAIENARKLISPGGHFIGTVSGVSQVSLYDADRWGDFYRFTPEAIAMHLRKHFSSVEVTVYGNHYALMNYLTGHAFEDLGKPQEIWNQDPLFPMIVGFIAT